MRAAQVESFPYLPSDGDEAVVHTFLWESPPRRSAIVVDAPRKLAMAGPEALVAEYSGVSAAGLE